MIVSLVIQKLVPVPWLTMCKALSQVISVSFLHYLSSIQSPLLLSSSSCHIVETPRLVKNEPSVIPTSIFITSSAPSWPCVLPWNMHTHVTRISNDVMRWGACRSELVVRSLVSSSLFIEIYLSRADAVVGSICGAWIRLSEQPHELAK